MKKFDSVIAWILVHCFFFSQLPLAAQDLRASAPHASGMQQLIRVSKIVRPHEEVVLELDGVTLLVPAGAVERTTEISITRLAAIAGLDEGMSNVTQGSTGWRFEPHGIQFHRPVRITMGFDRQVAGSPTALSNLYTYFHDDALGRWERLERECVDEKAATVTSVSRHFTDMINATLKLPEGPQPIQYDVSSIKKLEAANPGDGVPLPDGPQPGPFGAASFSIPLRLPSGRGGASPQLALRYSSDTGETWLGRGFDIEVPAITIDTRFGLPRYDGADRYMLNGEELLPIGTDRDGSLLFQPRTEKSFERIRWYRASGAGGGEDYWQVTEKNGAVSEYGRTAAQAWLGPDRASRSQTYAWYLSKRSDSFGNTISYSYFNDQRVSAPGNVANNYTYLCDIFYTGFQKTGESGAFHVQFTLEGADREDRRLDSRGTFPSKLARRLQQVSVFYRSSLVRTWQFSYMTNEFGQSLLSSFTETDGGASAQFYRYSFDYYTLPQHMDGGTFLGYDAFGPEEIWPLASSAPFKGLATTNTTSVGGDLYLGFEFSIWLPLIGKVAGASFGVRGGFQTSSSGSAGTLMDANGDGLPDLVWKSGGSLLAYLNTGSGFDTSRPFTLPGLFGIMDGEQANMFSFGVSAGLLGASGSITWQESWSQGKSAFVDVNGDGFVDYVNAGNGGFGLNNGSSLAFTTWSQVPSVSGGAQGALGEDMYNKTYYLQEPFRAWKAYRSGTVIVDQDASLLRPTSKSAVSLITDPPDGQSVPAPLRLGSSKTTASLQGQQLTMNAGDRIYFHMDAGSVMESDQEASQRTRWNVKIRYSSIKLFESLKDGAVFEPPLTLSPSSWDQRLGPIYTAQRDRGVVTGYVRNSDWQTLSAETLAPVYDALIERGYFIPLRVPKDMFIAVLNAAAAGSQIVFSSPQTKTTDDGKSYTATDISPSQAILQGYIYEPETATFIRTGVVEIPTLDPASATSDLVLERYLNVLTKEQKESLARVRTVDSASYTPVQLFDDSSVGYEVSVPQKVLGAVVSETGVQGNVLPTKGLLLETTYSPAGAPFERLWLRQDAGSQWTTLVRESLASQTFGQTTLEPGAAKAVVSQGSIAATISDRGVQRTFTFTNKGLVQQVPDSLYSGTLSAFILAGETFSADAFTVIPAASWSAMTNSNDPQSTTLQALQPCYTLGTDGDYHLADPSTYTNEQFQAALLALQAAVLQDGSVFMKYPLDASAAHRLVLLTQTQMDTLLAAIPASQQAAVSACFSQFTSTADGRTWFFQNPDLMATTRDLVLEAMQRYQRDAVLFPYFTFDPSANVWNIKPGVAADQTASDAVRAVMDSCGIQAWTTVDRTVRYTSAQSLPVIAQVSLPADAVEDLIVPTGTSTPGSGESVGVVMVPGFDAATGNTVVTPHYFHTFDSNLDFSSQNLVIFPTGSDGPLYHGEATMSGGVYGWYYGSWSGYYGWDKASVGKSSTTSEGTSKPPYSATMSANRQSDGSPSITTSGREYPVPVPSTAMIGNVSSYSEVTMNADLSTTTTEYRFAAFVSGDEIFIGRNGGDAYYRIPRGSGSGGGSLPFVRSSHTSANDINGSISLPGVGGSASRNSSTSWQYEGIMDFNGDRYPDLVSFSDSGSGSSSFSVLQGRGQGFGGTSTFSLPGSGHLARFDTTSYGFGASLSASSGGISENNDSKGRPKTITLLKPEPPSGVSGNIGLNGTFGSTVQSEGFYDMNGDGLPDYVRRNGADDYSVALNRGNGTFAAALDWGSGISAEAFPGGIAGDLKNRTEGVSFTGSGSFGANGGVSAGAGGFTVGVSGGFTATVSQTYSALIDVNGDGLADQVVKLKTEPFFRVRYNLGDHFSEEAHLYRPAWGIDESGYRTSVQQDLSSLSNGLNGVSIPGGFSIPGMQSLPDQSSNPLSAAIDPFSMDDDLEYSTGASFNLGANISISISFWLLALTIAPGLNGSVASTSASLKFTDIDGDGLPDHVLKLPMENFLRVKRNLSATIGLLKKIKAPQGGTYELAYARVGNTPQMPQSRWVLSSLTRDDGVLAMRGAPADRGVHAYAETYAYLGGFYDRTERMFYGFAEVTAARSSGAVSTTRYLNRDYYTRGMTSGSELKGPDANGQIALYQQSTVEVRKSLQRSVRRVSGQTVEIFFPNVASEATRQYQAGSSAYVETSRSYDYDAYGNVTDLYDNGTTGEPSQQVHARIIYDLNIPGADYQKQSPSSIRVESSTGSLMRLRQGKYGSSGELVQLDQYESAVTLRSYSLTYDPYGNLASITDPRGQTLEWAYDEQVHTYAVLIRSFNSSMASPEYDSIIEWDFTLGKKTAEVDQNSQRMSYSYDLFGRLVEVRSPYDTGSVPAVSYQYDTSAFPWTAVTFNKLLYDPSDSQTMQTVIAMDGLGRVLQTAKQGEQRDTLGVRTQGWNLSGAIAYDGNARVAQEGQPQFASGPALPALAVMKNSTTKSYDAQDRVVQQVLPDNATVLSSYGVTSGGIRVVQRTVDPLGNIEERETDGRGNITAVRRLSATGAMLMSATYSYDGLSQILSATDSRGSAVQVLYDLLGRRTSLQSPDTGIETRTYDASGNLSQKITSVLRGKGEAIDYQYDGLNRLTAIIYPESEAVKYTYGDPGAANNGAGRLVQRTDTSGTLRYQYGKLGETTQMSRSITRLTPLESPVSATFSYVSDYLGRLQQITYPDGEVLSYGYDSGGQVRTVTGVHWGQSTQYVRDIGYDEYGQRTYIEYGNGVRTSYSYDPYRRWLSSIGTQTQYGSVLQAMSYRFDLVGNILGYTNASAIYSTSQSYSYDALYQLVGAQGASSSHPSGFDEWTSSYQQSFSYDEIGNMTQKTSSVSTAPSRSVGDDLSYSLGYSYYTGKAHQAEVIGKLYYRYDANGNTIEEREGGHGTGVVLGGTVSKSGTLRMTDKGFGLVLSDSSTPASSVYTRYYVWDEENRLQRTVEGTLTVDYRYGADGQRAVKYSRGGESLYFDAMWQAQTDYPSLRQSKHVYVGSMRVATRLNIQGQLDVGYETVNTYYHHPDHLGSSQLVSDYAGNEYERVEYTPYGESWIEKRADTRELLPYKFTGKERDSETGLYYYGARYLNPRTSRWVSPDPAMESYLPEAPTSDEARKRNGNLPGMGGVFNSVNLAVYHYAGNNPLKYMDPTGLEGEFFQNLWTGIKNLFDPPKTTRASANASTNPSTGTAKTSEQAESAQTQNQTSLSMPTSGEVTSEFGPRAPIRTEAGTTSDFHKGFDVANAAGTPINAAAAGTILETGYQPDGYGYYAIIGHDSRGWAGLTTRYGHMQAMPTARRGDHAIQGQQIGTMGSTCMADGPHLHFEVRVNNVAQNPRDYLR